MRGGQSGESERQGDRSIMKGGTRDKGRGFPGRSRESRPVGLFNSRVSNAAEKKVEELIISSGRFQNSLYIRYLRRTALTRIGLETEKGEMA